MAEAFMDDMVWRATGPRNPAQRRIVLTALYLAEILITQWRSGILLGAFRGGRLDGVILAYADGVRPTPWWAWLPRSVACLVAGPLAVARSLGVLTGLELLHPKEPHVYFWLCASRSDALGTGYALTREVMAHADRLGLPCYVEATSPEVAQLIELLGWQVRDRYVLRTGDALTTLWRDARVAS